MVIPWTGTSVHSVTGELVPVRCFDGRRRYQLSLGNMITLKSVPIYITKL